MGAPVLGDRPSGWELLRSVGLVTVVLTSFALLAVQTMGISRVLSGADQVLVTDLGRDLMGAEAAARGQLPYQRLGALEPGLPTEWGRQWVAHPPFAIALARTLLALGDPMVAIDVFRILTLTALVALFLLTIRKGPNSAFAALAGGTLLFWAPTFSDLRWVQGEALTALGVIAVLSLDSSRRRGSSLVVLGVLAAWKPWLVILAPLLPGSSSAWKDGLGVGAVAAAINLAVLPWVGGWAALQAWAAEALPANLRLSRQIHGVLSTTAFWSHEVATLFYLMAIVLGVGLARRTMPARTWPAMAAATHLLFAPLVWDHHWVALFPAVAWPVWSGASSRVRWTVAAWLALSALSGAPVLAPQGLFAANWMALGILVATPALGVGLWYDALRRQTLGYGLQPVASDPATGQPQGGRWTCSAGTCMVSSGTKPSQTASRT